MTNINISYLRNWLFKSLSVESRLDDLEKDGVAVRAISDVRALQRVMPLEDFPSKIRVNAMNALQVYLAFFCLENSIRDLVSDRLQENHGANWWNDCVNAKIVEKVEKRKEREGENRWHIERGANPICYTDFGDLKDIINKNYGDFQELFPDIHWVSSRLTDLEMSRNIIAHSNILDDREIDRIKMYLKDWIKQVG